MRILIASHCEPIESLGAGQLAVRLGDSLRELGAEIVHWYPQVNGVKWWHHQSHCLRALKHFVEHNGPFDVVDSPAEYISKFDNHRGVVVARSIQPQLHYQTAQLIASWQDSLRDLRQLRRSVATSIHSLQVARAYIAGLNHADRILSLGTIEYNWMYRHFKHLRAKLWKHCLSPSASEQSQLPELRFLPRDVAKRILWIGRWCPQKGTDLLEEMLLAIFSADASATVTIAGFGSMEYLGLNKDLQTNGRIRLIPVFTRSELMELLASHNIGLLTSKAEGWGLVLNEMLEAGLTVYATETGGFVDLAPFFPNQLKKITAPTIPLERGEPEPDLQEYYRHFSWRSVAQTYMEMLGPDFTAKEVSNKTVGE